MTPGDDNKDDDGGDVRTLIVHIGKVEPGRDDFTAAGKSDTES